MKTFVLQFIRFYQQYLSLDTGFIKYFFPFGPVCRYTPRCSEYTYQAVKKYGILQGLHAGVLRILRCHPWSPGGYDPLS